MNELFRKFAQKTSRIAGKPITFLCALSFLILWLITGPYFNFSNTWQLVVNTSTTIITFLMVFLIQNTQNRDSRAMHLKIDELIRAVKGARISMVDAEELPDDKLELIHQEFKTINEQHGLELKKSKTPLRKNRSIAREPKL